MKKLFVMCIAVSCLATACNSCQHDPNNDKPVVVTPDDTGDSASKMIDTSTKTVAVKDSAKETGKKM